MTVECFRQLVRLLETESVVMATVIQTQGSVPREVGAKMLICSGGRTVSTIGGGAGEAKVIRQAIAILDSGSKQLVVIDLSGSPQRDTQGVCGGKMQVWLERWSGEPAIATVQDILAGLQAGQPVTLITPFTDQRSPYVLPTNATPDLTSAFIETLHPAPTLLIIGAGHCGIQLATVAHLVGFQILIQDDRPDWANSQHYPQAAQIFTLPIAATLAHLATHPQLYVALTTRSYHHDLEALTALLNRDQPCLYIGMIGSKKRVQQVYHALESIGIPSTTLQSIHAPIGLDIGALTPAEIAVSIVAELILVQRGGTGSPLSDQQKS